MIKNLIWQIRSVKKSYDQSYENGKFDKKIPE